eukprot:TRINITY_DN25265_c0_g1_i1.p2 TRINITY_DN25265_c0_g1~~TRINITY_DN25265_c0_g1_i1.p2  ORF type:complete len:126 (+),score=24.24 TRINITY_DN25265_c0_g1_i1:354-731(+)
MNAAAFDNLMSLLSSIFFGYRVKNVDLVSNPCLRAVSKKHQFLRERLLDTHHAVHYVEAFAGIRIFNFLPRTHVLCVDTVSYTHLTLPTILLVQISEVAVSLKKKTNQKKKKDVMTQRKEKLDSH